MNRWTGSWLGGPGSAGLTPAHTVYKGERLGLPEAGAGSLAGTGRRVGQYLLDALSSSLVTALIVRPPANWPLVTFTVLTVVTLVLFGQTLGMRLLGMRLQPLTGGRVTPWMAVRRTALLVLFIPALITDKDGRGLHDKAAGTVLLRS